MFDMNALYEHVSSIYCPIAAIRYEKHPSGMTPIADI